MSVAKNRCIGLALGGGSARGWAHIGVLQELSAMGVEPDVVCGTSIGAFIGATYVSGHLEMLESWAHSLNTRQIIRYLDIKLMAGGGLADGKRLIEFFTERIGDRLIEELPKPFCVVATELHTGNEIWIKDGPLWDAVRASIALPGLLTPAKIHNRWLVDGGLVNPVPVSACRVMGAETVIAVNLNGDVIGRRQAGRDDETKTSDNTETRMLDKLPDALKERIEPFVSQWLERPEYTPGLLDVFASSLDIMQDRITRSRLAGDPPDVIIAPKLGHIGLLEFDRAAEVIDIGRASAKLMAPALHDALGMEG